MSISASVGFWLEVEWGYGGPNIHLCRKLLYLDICWKCMVPNAIFFFFANWDKDTCNILKLQTPCSNEWICNMILKIEMWADLSIIADQLTHGKYIGKSLLKWVNNANKCIITIIYISMGIFNSTLTNVYIFQHRGHCFSSPSSPPRTSSSLMQPSVLAKRPNFKGFCYAEMLWSNHLTYCCTCCFVFQEATNFLYVSYKRNVSIFNPFTDDSKLRSRPVSGSWPCISA